jgi:hypothetical protein
MTKRYLESLPEEEQDKILGEIDPDEYADLTGAPENTPFDMGADYLDYLVESDQLNISGIGASIELLEHFNITEDQVYRIRDYWNWRRR